VTSSGLMEPISYLQQNVKMSNSHGDDNPSHNHSSFHNVMHDDENKHLLDPLDMFGSAFSGLPNLGLTLPMQGGMNNSMTSPMGHLTSDHNTGVSKGHYQEDIKGYNVITSLDGRSQKILMSVNINLFKIATQNARTNIIPALSKPAFCPLNDSHFVVGTEEQDFAKKTSNFLIFSSIDDSSVTVRFTCPLPEHLRDIIWIDGTNIIFAANSKIGLIKVNHEVTVEDTIMFPEFHKDTIREIAINSAGGRHLIISGGFDGNVFVTDITRLTADIQKNEKKSENSLYPCKEVVSSVNWHPTDPTLASCTTDSGILHIFDIRTDKRRPAVVFDTSKKELYTHAYRDPSTLLLGFGDGTMQTFDVRSRRTFLSFGDPHLAQIGDIKPQIGEIKFDHQTKNFAVFGSPEFSLWSFDDSAMHLCTHHQLADSTVIANNPMYKTSGDFRKGNKMLAVTDSNGTFALYDFSHL